MKPINDNARRQPGVEGNGTADSGDCAAKRAAAATARAALLGIEVRDGWLLWDTARARVVAMGVGPDALNATVSALEAKCATRDLVQRMRGGA